MTFRLKSAVQNDSENVMWWLGFRQIKVKTAEGVKHHAGKAVVIDPYQSEGKAQKERMRCLSTEWDAAYSQPFQAADNAAAEAMVDSIRPKQ
jgi:hypothetical protein